MRGAEVIVVGAGHNGLICAAYLARAGVDTVVVESRDDVGGVTSTVSAMGSRFNVCNCDHSLIRAMPIIDELDLGSHGLEYLAPEVGLVNMFHDRAQPWLMFHDTDRTLDALAVTYPRQVEPYRRYLRDALPVAELVLEIARVPPGARSILEAGLVAGRGRAAARLLAWSRRSATDVLSRYFDDWHMSMPAISTGPTMWGASPDDRGTGLAAIGHAMRHVVRSGRPRGGSGALTHAIRGSFEAAGGRVRCASAVDRLLVSGGRARGVGLTDGTELTASVVVSACDPRAVLVDWIREPPPAARRLARRWRRRVVPEGYQSKIDAVLATLPVHAASERLPTHLGSLDLLGPTTVVSPTPADLAESHRRREAGLVAGRPTMLVNVPTVVDPDMAPDGKHVLSLEVLFTPYSLRGGWAASAEPARWIEMWAELVTPTTGAVISDWRAMTPDRYEREFAMHRGHTPAYAGSPLASLVGRRREVSRYRTPIEGLYLTGAGTYPGAGVFGAAGRNTATIVMEDIRAGERR